MEIKWSNHHKYSIEFEPEEHDSFVAIAANENMTPETFLRWCIAVGLKINALSNESKGV